MCRTLFAVKIVGIGYTTSMAVKEIRVPSRGMRQTDVHMVRCVMSRYIDADALVIDYYDDYETKDDEYTYAYVSEYQIYTAPSIDIVRCKECKNARNIESEWICEHLSGMVGLNVVVNADDFCSYGERKESE